MSVRLPSVLRDLWEDKPVLITLVVAVAAIIYIFYRQSHANLVAQATDQAGIQASQPVGGTYVEESHYTSMATTNNYATGTPFTPVASMTGAVAPVATSVPKATPTQSSSGGGLLGPHVRVFPNFKAGQFYYRSPQTGGKIVPVPLPSGTRYAPGANGRYWYWLPGSSQQQLLTSGEA